MSDTRTTQVQLRHAGSGTPRSHNPMSGIVVAGIGNPLLSDDGLGVYAMERLRLLRPWGADTRYVDGGTLGPELLGQISGCRKLLFLDAVDVDARPGSIVRVELDGPTQTGWKTSLHDFGIPELLDDLRLLGETPDEVVLLGIQPCNVQLGTSFSSAVASAIPALLEAASSQVLRWESSISQGLTPGVNNFGGIHYEQ